MLGGGPGTVVLRFMILGLVWKVAWFYQHCVLWCQQKLIRWRIVTKSCDAMVWFKSGAFLWVVDGNLVDSSGSTHSWGVFARPGVTRASHAPNLLSFSNSHRIWFSAEIFQNSQVQFCKANLWPSKRNLDFQKKQHSCLLSRRKYVFWGSRSLDTFLGFDLTQRQHWVVTDNLPGCLLLPWTTLSTRWADQDATFTLPNNNKNNINAKTKIMTTTMLAGPLSPPDVGRERCLTLAQSHAIDPRMSMIGIFWKIWLVLGLVGMVLTFCKWSDCILFIWQMVSFLMFYMSDVSSQMASFISPSQMSCH